MTPKQLAEEAADKSWGIAESGKGMMQDAVEAALLAFAKAHAEEFRRLARGSCSQSNIARVMGATFSATLEEGKAEAYHKAAQMLEEELNG